MVALFYLIVVEQIVQGLYSLWQGMRWLAMARRRLATWGGAYTPRVALFCPVKGIEPGLEENLLALTKFDYLDYAIFFSITGPEDAAYPVLKRVAGASVRPVHIVEAGRAHDCGEKVNNLRAAVKEAGRDFDVFAFADSDGRPNRRWLGRLVAPLADVDLGAATTFRWLLPNNAGFWSAFACSWNAPIATYLGDHGGNFCWGGGTAIRRDRFEETRVIEAWSGSVSDDFSLTHAVKSAGYSIAFVPECLVPSPTETLARGFFEFTTRQMIITRVYEPRLWIRAGLAHLLYCTAVLLGVALWAGNFARALPRMHFLVLAMIPPVLAAIRGWQRLWAVVEILPEWRRQLLANGWIWTLLAPLVPFVALYNSIWSGVGREIKWRGVRYRLLSPRDTRILNY